jgi:hypothetical protein
LNKHEREYRDSQITRGMAWMENYFQEWNSFSWQTVWAMYKNEIQVQVRWILEKS